MAIVGFWGIRAQEEPSSNALGGFSPSELDSKLRTFEEFRGCLKGFGMAGQAAWSSSPCHAGNPMHQPRHSQGVVALPGEMKLLSYIHPARTFLPCSGVGRHINGVLSALAVRDDTEVELLCAGEWTGDDGLLPAECPLRSLPMRTFPGKESHRERLWKLINLPKMNRHVMGTADWVYCPMETRLPVRKVPVAITLHDIQAFEDSLPWSQTRAHRRNRRMWGMWLPKALREARLVFTVSEFSKGRMVELLGVPEEKIFVSGNGVDTAYFEQVPGPATMAPPYVLLVGGLRVEKGGRDTLEVARLLRGIYPELEFRVVGMPNDPALVTQAEELGSFRFLGKVPDSELPGLYREAVCLLFLSLYEGFGMPPLEAMACGSPVICSDQASLPEIVGEAAACFPPGSVDEVVDRIHALIESSQLRKEMAMGGQRHSAKFTWERVAARVVSALADHS